jgi:hypothetical protein
MAITTLESLKHSSRRLLSYAANVTSQNGEDGIISECLRVLATNDHWCVEFGAWDGKQLSNTYNLVASREYQAVLIEPDPRKFCELDTTYEYRDRIIPIQRFVGFTPEDGLDTILQPLPIPRDFDVLSIDIDGNDYHVWSAVRNYRPKLVVIEYNPTISNCVTFVQERNPSVSQGSSAAALVELGKSKEYELVAATIANLVFVDRQYFELFGIPDNSLELMRDDSACPHIFVGFDGSVKLSEAGQQGSIALWWHGIRIKEESIQQLPRVLRAYPETYRLWQRLAFAFIFLFRRDRHRMIWRAMKSRLARLRWV